MKTFKHSIRMKSEKCYGCTVCIKKCPTQAIRVYGGKSSIINPRCIDCGECVKACPNKSKYCTTDPLSRIHDYKYKVAICSPIIFGQFDELIDINVALDAVENLGFDFVYESSIGAMVYAETAKEYIKEHAFDEKVISSSCPVVMRLIQTTYPDLIENILPLKTPDEITATIAKEEIIEKYKCKESEVGVFLITTCPAQMKNITEPLGFEKSKIDGVISVIDVYAKLQQYVATMPEETKNKSQSSTLGIGWFNVRGQTRALEQDNHLVVDGIHNVVEALDQYENNKFPRLKFFEGLACKGGCSGGALAYENTYVSKNRIDNFIAYINKHNIVTPMDITKYVDLDRWKFDEEILEHDVNKLDADMVEALKKYNEIEEITKELPGLDCAACGCPTCKSLAEDIVKGYASEFDCIFIMRTKLNLTNRDDDYDDEE